MEEKIEQLIAKVDQLQMNIDWMLPRMVKAGSLQDLDNKADANYDLMREKLFSPIPEPNFSRPIQ